MSSKQILLKQFTATYNENGWFVALKNALNNMTAEQASWKPENADNSIWEILGHLNYYNYAYSERFKGIDYVYPANNNDETFVSEDVSETAWELQIEKFDAIMTGWRELLEAADEAKFDEAVSATNQASWGALLSHVNLHNAHHGGQIVILRKIQGSWDASKGIS